MNNIKKIEMAPIDDSEIRQYLGEDTKIIDYSDLQKYRNINELLPNEMDYVIILIEMSHNYGHWVCLLKYNGMYEYFDSLGYPPDDLRWINKSQRIKLGESQPLIKLLFRNSPIKSLKYNKIKYQAKTKNTCGRWCIKSYDQIISYFINII